MKDEEEITSQHECSNVKKDGRKKEEGRTCDERRQNDREKEESNKVRRDMCRTHGNKEHQTNSSDMRTISI